MITATSWRDDAPTEKQRQAIFNLSNALDEEVPSYKTKGEASDIINELSESMRMASFNRSLHYINEDRLAYNQAFSNY